MKATVPDWYPSELREAFDGWDEGVADHSTHHYLIHAYCYILRCSVTISWLKWILVDKLTPNLGFSIPFYLNNHDHDSKWAGCTWGSDMYVPPIHAYCYILRCSVTFFGLKWIPVNNTVWVTIYLNHWLLIVEKWCGNSVNFQPHNFYQVSIFCLQWYGIDQLRPHNQL